MESLPGSGTTRNLILASWLVGDTLLLLDAARLFALRRAVSRVTGAVHVKACAFRARRLPGLHGTARIEGLRLWLSTGNNPGMSARSPRSREHSPMERKAL
jgi:hypothetical protein